MSEILRFIGVNKDTLTAGPGKRLELFTKGCIRGVVSPCEGCFNQSSWTFEGKHREMTVEEVIEICEQDSWNRQVTFCGGEPILQARALTKVASKLKEIDSDFHFVMYTAYKLDVLMKYGLKFTWVKEKHGESMYDALYDYCNYGVPLESYFDEHDNYVHTKVKFTILTPEDVRELMSYIDIIVDGDYQYDKRLTTSTYMHDGWFIGSSNQRVIFAPRSVEANKLIFKGAKEYNELRQSRSHCKCCGKITPSDKIFCGEKCSTLFAEREIKMFSFGGA